ncbi:bifunctional D-glycero-beta-D-manno-heptose-7-phosphate kinase/D-glycero-beta-D-manno-heptose 1-phosphate adenylyltransferase HldE [Thiohalomonas denitrificans]|uniref:bifunctional D-glycero-beta-D-manno-heptose-7-phosphate kinase/D-glycero-beta-D-manno-heptose 1-phosphate adenylyltransferase HldE n=1 Tax=Thiohalomonas denitrificans TaxID=415747 RepID=UPI0026EBF9AB|nr:bifunctional D-glycero-beta-D-manno-heptose-7-phosphate kinase/D-glycero-beta-D-manno-heptose 1-phosphate adenylyltransferase HldE [Thiohalomonas denitrificans]
MKISLPPFENARVLVVGDVMLDRYWHGDTSRISPEAPVPVVTVGDGEERPGGAGNVALNIAALGSSSSVIGLTGDDEAADALEKVLGGASVGCVFVRLTGYPTVTKLRVMSRHQQLIRLDFENGFPGCDHDALIERFRAELPRTDVVVLSDYGKGVLRETCPEIIRLAREAGKPVLIDPKGNDFIRYRGATLMTPNMPEFEAVVGLCADDNELVERGEELRRELGLEALLITRSEKGVTLLRAGHVPLHLPTRAREVFDVTGAGDTVISVLAAAVAAGQDLAEATSLANIAAGVVVGKLGTATVTPDELRRAMREQDEVVRGVVDEEHLVALVQEARSHGERVVVTNGCFDILHAGHVTYLQQAAELGDRLIIAVNDDASVRRLKGEERPVNTMENRMHVLAALGCVDWVVPFFEDTPERLICRLAPDVLVKGGDNDPDNIPGGGCVQDAGGEVLVMSFVDGCSTTGLIQAIRSSEQKKG